MEKFRITKYDPRNRNNEGHYLFDHWTETSDVGKTLEGELVTEEAYFKVEENYINALVEILNESNQDYLRLVGFNNEKFKDSLIENREEWYHEKIFEDLKLYEDKKIYLDEIPSIIKLNLRNYFDSSLEIIGKYYVQFGYDFYMYVGAPSISEELINRLNSTLIFVEEFWSPYYSPQLEYVVLINEKDLMYIKEQQVLESITIEKMKEIFKLSKEHPGRIYAPITKEIADKIGIEVDFEKFEYSLRTELVIE